MEGKDESRADAKAYFGLRHAPDLLSSAAAWGNDDPLVWELPVTSLSIEQTTSLPPTPPPNPTDSDDFLPFPDIQSQISARDRVSDDDTVSSIATPSSSTNHSDDFERISATRDLPPAEKPTSGLKPKTPVQRASKAVTLFSRRSQARKPSQKQYKTMQTMDDGGSGNDYDSPQWQQAGENADPQDVAGPGAQGRLDCTVAKPQKEGEGTQNAYISYLVTTDTDFKSFQTSHSEVRRRFTDFVFLYKTLQREYPQCAVPPLPDKHNMSYVRGGRFEADFTARRGYSLQRFLRRLTLHPVLRRAVILTLFLESSDWNATMRSRPSRGMSGSESAGSSSVLETWTDSLLNAFTKTHKADKRFVEVSDRSSKLTEDLSIVSKTVARVAKRESDLETDYSDLATQFQKLAALEPGVAAELTNFSACVQQTSEGWKGVKAHTDQDYLGSLKDMEAYISSLRSLLKTREQKQLDFEALTDYLTKAASERDHLASSSSSTGTGPTGFLRSKIEDVRGVDHEQARRERVRKLEVQIQRLTSEVENAKKTSEAFDEEVVKEVGDFERIKAVEFRGELGGLAEAEGQFFRDNIKVWEKFVQDMEGMEKERVEREGQGQGAPASVMA